jgi:putative iron-regulated protein
MRECFALLVAAILAAVSIAGVAAGESCRGDCDGNGHVTVGEIVKGAHLALAERGTEECQALDADADDVVSVDELVEAVGRSLHGCVDAPVTNSEVVQHYAEMLYAEYADSVEGAEKLQAAIETFLASPSATRFALAKSAWRAARPAYLQTEGARFYGGPIDDDNTGREEFINSWPLDESFIDYVQGQPDAGIINRPDLYPTIDANLLRGLNESESETSISTGWHAIEFLLWGQDFNANGPGMRPYTDYVVGAGGTAANQARRGDYLRTLAAMLVDDLSYVRDAWTPGADNYRALFATLTGKEALSRILTGLGTMSGGELTGERLAVAFDTKDQEDEHSCFSDNTHNDLRFDEIGIQNFFFGRYGDLSGPSLYLLIEAVNPDLAAATRDAIWSARNAIYEIPPPFDQAILGSDDTPGRRAIAAAIQALNVQTDQIAACAEALGVPISVTTP